ncbi:MAG: transcriptional repressor, partial [Christensenella sp.]
MKNTRQKELILNEIRASKSHPTADEIYEALKDECPRLSLATVYRNLAAFCEAGLALRLPTFGKDRFDGRITRHFHFICEKCGELFDIEPAGFDDFRAAVESESGFEVEGQNILLYGRCD